MISSDKQRLQQIILNLMTCSIRYSDVGQTVEVCSKIVRHPDDLSVQDEMFIELLSDDEQNQMLEVQIKDNGVGMSQDDIKKLFKSYGDNDAQSSLNDHGGGQSLFITKIITQLLGGTIVCESTKAIGTTFTFLIGLDQSQSEQQTSETLVERIRNPHINRHYPKVYYQKNLEKDDKIGPEKIVESMASDQVISL